jgi:hypothetical protein
MNMSTIHTFLLVLAFLTAALASGLDTAQSDKPATSEARKEKSPPTPGDKNKESKTQTKHRGKFTISKETTYVTEPLDRYGYIDYARALNQRLSQGVTPENNANVLIWKALGPHPEGGAGMPAEFFQWLGIPAPPEKGDYFIDLKDFLKVNRRGQEADELEDRLDRITRWPWTAKEHPELASWLEKNDKPLALVVEATKRSHYFSPIVPAKTEKGPGWLLGAPMPGVYKCRTLAHAIRARAMLRLSEGKHDATWQDLVACHRLGRMVARGATLSDALVGLAIDGVAGKGDLAFLNRDKLDAKQIQMCLHDLQSLPPLLDMADKVNLYQRFEFLNSVMIIDHDGIKILEGLTAVGKDKQETNPLADLILEGIDWDPAMRNGNRWYDRLVAAMGIKDRDLRQKKFAEMDGEVKGLKKKWVDSENLRSAVLEDPGKVVSEAIGDVLIALLMPSGRVQYGPERLKQVQDNLCVAFALEWYRRDHGRYPRTLEALAPKYLAQIPQDIFSGKPLIYRPSEKGYLLYSVGINGKDEGGRSYDDDPPGDDLVIRMPLPELPKK